MINISANTKIGLEERAGAALWQAVVVENRPYRLLNLIVQELASGNVFLDDPSEYRFLTDEVRAHARSLHVLSSPDAKILNLGDFPNLEWLRIDLPKNVRVRVGSTPALKKVTSNTPEFEFDNPTTIRTLSAHCWRGCLKDHLAPFTRIEELFLHGLAIERIDLPGSAGALRHLHVSQCSKLLGLEPSPTVRALHTLSASFCKRFILNEIPHRLETLRLIDTAPLPSAKPIAELRYLRHIYLGGSSRIADGDVNPILERWDELESVFVAAARVHNRRVPDKGPGSPLATAATPRLKFSELRKLLEMVPEGRRRLARKFPALAETLLAALDNGKDEDIGL